MPVVAFDRDAFVARCIEALTEPSPPSAIAEVVGEAVADPRAFTDVVHLPLDPADDGILHRSPELMIVHVVFPQGFRTGMHDHRMPAVIGAWAGYEDNLLFRRTPDGLERTGVRRIESGDVLLLGDDVVHDVHAPAGSWTAALHVYLGDLGTVARSSWAGPEAPEQPCVADEMEERWLAQAVATGLVALPEADSSGPASA